jgi:hypothetical protein
MNRNEFNRFIAGDVLPGPGDLEGLRELTVLFPWFHCAHMLLLRGLKENADIRFDTQLKASALSVSDREVLYHYLFMQPAVETEKEEAAPVAETQEEVIQEEASPVTEVQEEIIEEAATPVAEVQEEIVHEETAPVAEVQEEIVPEEASPVAEAQEEIIEEVATPMAEVQEEIIQEVATPMAEVQEEIIQEVDAKVAETQEEIIQEEVVYTEAAPAETVQSETWQDEIMPEDAAAELAPAMEAGPPATEVSTWRTREELMAEIEARLEELSSQHEEVPETEKRLEELSPQHEEVPEPEARHEELSSQHEEVPGPEARLEELSSQHEEVPQTEARLEEFSSQHEEAPETETAVLQDAEQSKTETPVPQEAEVAVAEVQPEPEPAGEELLELLTDNGPFAPEPAKPLTPRDLIDRFIQNSPNLERIPLAENQPVKDLSEPGTEEHGKFITETLAKIYINQGYYTRAINIYEKLSLQFPEKSAYFAGRIEKIKDLIK